MRKDPNQIMEETLHKFNNLPVEQMTVSTLATLNDIIKFHKWQEADLRKIVERLVLFIGQLPAANISKSDAQIMDKLKENFKEAMTGDFDDVFLEPLLKKLDKNLDAFVIVIILDCLKATYDKRYRPIVEKYLAHDNPGVRRYAREAMALLIY